MSWSELERLVADAETTADLHKALRACQSQVDLLLAARSRGYHITRIDLLRAWKQHQGLAMRRASGS